MNPTWLQISISHRALILPIAINRIQIEPNRKIKIKQINQFKVFHFYSLSLLFILFQNQCPQQKQRYFFWK
jgi:hypothetical protein